MADHESGTGHVNPASTAAGHEVTDADASPLAKVGIGIAVLMLVAFIGMLVMFRVLLHVQPMYEPSPEPHPLRDLRSTSTEPRLQPDPPREKAELRQVEDHLLTTYNWVDQEQGLARIPVDRAIELLSQAGLPEKTGSGASMPPPATEE
jgi:hypothetical protein